MGGPDLLSRFRWTLCIISTVLLVVSIVFLGLLWLFPNSLEKVARPAMAAHIADHLTSTIPALEQADSQARIALRDALATATAAPQGESPRLATSIEQLLDPVCLCNPRSLDKAVGKIALQSYASRTGVVVNRARGVIAEQYQAQAAQLSLLARIWAWLCVLGGGMGLVFSILRFTEIRRPIAPFALSIGLGIPAFTLLLVLLGVSFAVTPLLGFGMWVLLAVHGLVLLSLIDLTANHGEIWSGLRPVRT